MTIDNSQLAIDTLADSSLQVASLQTASLSAVELSDDELEGVSGGMSLNLGDIGSFAQDSSNFFEHTTVGIQQGTFAGPEGSGTFSTTLFDQVKSGASQKISLG